MTDSWWLKVKRAQKHMVDIRAEVRRYAERHPYKFVRIRQPDSQRNVSFRVHVTEKPDPIISMMFGDFVHNLRSALDHIIVACIPKKERTEATGFPIVYKDIFARDKDGEFVVKDAKARENFDRSIRGIDPSARAIVILSQPYHVGEQARLWTLGIINRIDNADKHRALTEIGGGVTRPIVHFPSGERMEYVGLGRYSLAGEGTIIGWKIPADDPWQPSKVDVQFSGTAAVFFKVTGVRGGKEKPFDMHLYLTMLSALQAVRRTLRVLERFVIR
jgi:hypothetical protein